MWAAGLVAAIGVSVLGVFCFLSVIQLAMLSSKEKVMMKYSVVVITKLALGLLASKLVWFFNIKTVVKRTINPPRFSTGTGNFINAHNYTNLRLLSKHALFKNSPTYT